MRLLLLRHAPTAETGSTLTGRAGGVPLSPEGREMARRLGERIASVDVHSVYTSPVQRCRETARIVAESWALQPVPYRSFTEVDFGSWTGRKLSSLRRTKQWRELFVSAARFRFPGGETLGEVQARAVAAAEALADRHAADTIAVVSHADVIRTMLAHYLGMPLDLVHRLDVAAASVSLIHLAPGGQPHVPVVNDTGDPERWR
jgi:probable phosphoglycerate mutase